MSNLRLQVAGSQLVQLKIIVLWSESLGVRTPYRGGKQQRIYSAREFSAFYSTKRRLQKVVWNVSDPIANLVSLFVVGLVYLTQRITPILYEWHGYLRTLADAQWTKGGRLAVR